ncbi:MAG: histidine phosphatase family protein [Shewanella sp.]
MPRATTSATNTTIDATKSGGDSTEFTNVRIMLFRHGLCHGGAIFRGHSDVAPSALGLQQLQQALTHSYERLGAPHLIVCSDLGRCRQGLMTFYQQHWPDGAGPKIEVTEQLRELNYGDWDGQLISDIYQHTPSAVEDFYADPWAFTPPNAETMAAFAARLDSLWQQVLTSVLTRAPACAHAMNAPDNRHNHSTPCVWLVTHGGVMRYLMAKALGLGQHAGIYSQLQLGYGAEVEIMACLDKGQWHLRLIWPSAVG